MLHVPSPFVQCALARKEGPGGLASRAGSAGAFGPAKEAGEFGEGGTPPNDRTDSDLL